jgi:hypothetical protein
LFTAGDQVPVMPLSEVVGSEKLPPEQIGATCAKLGVTVWIDHNGHRGGNGALSGSWV